MKTPGEQRNPPSPDVHAGGVATLRHALAVRCVGRVGRTTRPFISSPRNRLCPPFLKTSLIATGIKHGHSASTTSGIFTSAIRRAGFPMGAKPLMGPVKKAERLTPLATITTIPTHGRLPSGDQANARAHFQSARGVTDTVSVENSPTGGVTPSIHHS